MLRRTTVAAVLFACAALSAAAAVPAISLSKSSYTFSEADGNAVFTVTRSGDLSGSSSVAWFGTIDTQHSGSISFAPNESTKTISMPIPNDDVWDDRTGDFVALTNASNATLVSPSQATVTIVDDDPRPEVSITDVTVVEGNSGVTAVHLTVTLSHPYKRSAVFYAETRDGTAMKGSDYNGNYYPGSQQFLMTTPWAPRQLSYDLVVYVNGDTTPEPDEYFTVSVNVNFFPGYNTARVTILNDDPILTPAAQSITRGGTGQATVGSSVPGASAKHVLLSSSNPSVATVPPFVDIAAGASNQTFDIAAVAAGNATITAVVPGAQETLMSDVTVFENGALTFDRPNGVALSLGATTTVTAHFAPPPAAPIDVLLKQKGAQLATLPSSFTVGTNGTGTFTMRAIANGTTSIQATLPALYGGVVTSFSLFVTPSSTLAITRVDAASGSTHGGESISISADHSSGRCVATFGGVPALNTSNAVAGVVTTTAPPHDAGVVDVTLRCGDQMSVVPDGYRYLSTPARLTAITPASGSINGGTLIKGAGDNFRRGRCTLWLGGAAATTVENDLMTEMVAAAPAHAAGAVDVTLRCGSDTSMIASAFTYIAEEPAASIAAVTPLSAAPGERIVIGGSRFRQSDAIFVGNISAVSVSTTGSEHVVTVPDVPAGNAAITLTDAAGHTISGPALRALTPVTPQIFSAPDHVPASSEFRVSGTGLRRSLTFFAGDTPLILMSVAPTYAQLRLPPSIAPGTTTLKMNGDTRPLEVTSNGLAVISISPQCASAEGGGLMTITGNGFASGAVVSVGAADSADVTVSDAHTIVARVPPSSGFPIESVTVTNPSGESGQLTNAFHYGDCGPSRHRGAAH